MGRRRGEGIKGRAVALLKALLQLLEEVPLLGGRRERGRQGQQGGGEALEGAGVHAGLEPVERPPRKPAHPQGRPHGHGIHNLGVRLALRKARRPGDELHPSPLAVDLHVLQPLFEGELGRLHGLLDGAYQLEHRLDGADQPDGVGALVV